MLWFWVGLPGGGKDPMFSRAAWRNALLIASAALAIWAVFDSANRAGIVAIIGGIWALYTVGGIKF